MPPRGWRLGLRDADFRDGTIELGIVLTGRWQNLHCLEAMTEVYVVVVTEHCLQVSVQCDASHRRAVPIPVSAVPDPPSIVIGVLISSF
jgi:hypothetical protein